MTKLVSDSDFAQIRSAAFDVSETFLQKEIVYRLFKDSMSRMNSDSNKNTNYENFNVLGLVVWSEKKPLETRQGIVDLSDGHVLFNIDQLKAVQNVTIIPAPIPPDTEVITKLYSGDYRLMQEGQDRLIIDGEEMFVLMIQEKGQLKDQNVMMKVFFQKQAPAI